MTDRHRTACTSNLAVRLLRLAFVAPVALWIGALSCAALSWAALSSSALAQSSQDSGSTIKVEFRESVPHLSLSVPKLDGPALRDKLASGLPQMIVMRHYAYRASGGKPLSVTVFSCRVVFDIWQEQYRVQLQRGLKDEVRNYDNVEQVVEACLTVRDLPIGQASDYRPGKKIYLATLVELNPLSDQTVARIRRWLARPGGGDIERQAFFGSFVSLFVNHRIGDAERSVQLRSTKLEVP